ncbi:hypothetical protein F0562_035705 [Nyssa sinensis]|uniref:Retrovirus-related Pol polyprotein from transposon TNT 1-94-like beta-barrel domain-containing protein n=1 Tax=Nyssa sinensis TaxID=561372 RepID=A0A5J5ACM1_9ASTE|nr:hypothetical protein F0562_035705 [Nyssa sinensis]
MMTSTKENQPLPTASVAHPGIISKASVFSTTSKNRTWIIDTGALDHMTRDFSQLKSVILSPQSVISIANGSTSPITREGSVILSNTLILDTVLVVSFLEYNLLSDILTWKILGYGVRRGKLYYLELTENGGSKISQANQASSEDKARGESSTEENVQQENGRGDEFIELEEVNEHFKQQGRNDMQQCCDHNHETESESLISPEEALVFPDITESPLIPLELPPSTPLTEESTQNVPPQVNTNPVFVESNETYVPAENIAPRYPQRLNRGVPKK